MARGRILKNQISVSEQVNDLSLKSALLFTWMISHADDFGRMTGSPRKLKAVVAPMRDDISVEDIKISLREMVDKGLINLYKVKEDFFVQFPSFDAHQQGLSKRTESKIPEFREELRASFYEIPRNSQKFTEIPASCARAEHEQEQEQEHEHEEKRKRKEGSVRETISAEVPVENFENFSEPIAADAAVSLAAPAKPCLISKPKTIVDRIFEHWREVMGTHRSQLNDKRKGFIRQALAWGYTEDDLCEAIAGCAVTPHNLGDNDKGEIYNGLNVIFKSADNIDRFIRNARSPPKPKNKTEKLFDENFAVAESWAQRKKRELGEMNV